ncbi:MAG: tetratricopeptide repeat protein [Acidobacteria bacterium]|nr:tetratricopeptide repeat protein [Acidobacteriota bacterium]
MNLRAIARFCACALIVTAPAAASAQNREHQQLFADLRILQEQTQQLRVAVASLADALRALDTRTAATADTQADATRKLFADQGLVIGALTDSARILREKMDGTNVSLSKDAHELETMRRELAVQRTFLTQIIALLTPATDRVDPNDPAAAALPTDPSMLPVPPRAVPPPQDPQRAFDAAFGDYAIGQFDMAITGFEYYIKTFPTSPDAPKARFHIAEAYYPKGSYQEAVSAYAQVITIDKGTDWEPQALYKQGLAYEQLGQTERAKANWELVKRSFPDSNAHMLATQGLARIIK